jgi:hypothetical protein
MPALLDSRWWGRSSGGGPRTVHGHASEPARQPGPASRRGALELDGLDDEQLRRPMVPSGTNLLGLVKHLASVEYSWFCQTFGRETEPLPFDDDQKPDLRVAAHRRHPGVLPPGPRRGRPGDQRARRRRSRHRMVRRGGDGALGAHPHDRGDRPARRAHGHRARVSSTEPPATSRRLMSVRHRARPAFHGSDTAATRSSTARGRLHCEARRHSAATCCFLRHKYTVTTDSQNMPRGRLIVARDPCRDQRERASRRSAIETVRVLRGRRARWHAQFPHVR